MKYTLNEDLFENAMDEEESYDKTIDTPQPGHDTGLANLIISAINDEWEAIRGYNDLIANMQNHNNMIEIIQDIIAEENTHVGQLEHLLKLISPNVENIQLGVEEAKEQLDDR